MSNRNLMVCVSYFNEFLDNAAKSTETTWGEFSDALLAGHPVTTLDKSVLPLFNACRYLNVGDPHVDNGYDKQGKPIKNFSSTHVRRHGPNIISVSMLVLDYDGGMALEQVSDFFKDYEYICYTSINHRVPKEDGSPPVDRFRVVLPTAGPIPIKLFRKFKYSILNWVNANGCIFLDDSALSAGQVFLLPAAREKHVSHAKVWHNNGALLDWTGFTANNKLQSPQKNYTAHSVTRTTNARLNPDDVLETLNGPIVVRDIREKTSNVRCPFHADRRPSEFVGITTNGLPFLQCKRCGRVYMARHKSDPIIDGIARIREVMRIRQSKEVP